MTRGLTKKQVLGEFRTAEIVAAAKKVIAAKGFAAATMDEIAEAAQIAKGTIYLYFKGKDQLFQAVAADTLAGLVARIREIHHGAGTATAKLMAVLKVMVETLEEEKALFRVYITEFPCLMRRPEGDLPSVADMDQEFTAAVAAVVEEGRGTGEFQVPDARKAGYLLRGITRGLAIAQMVDCEEEPLEDNLPWLTEFILRGLGARQGEKGWERHELG